MLSKFRVWVSREQYDQLNTTRQEAGLSWPNFTALLAWRLNFLDTPPRLPDNGDLFRPTLRAHPDDIKALRTYVTENNLRYRDVIIHAASNVPREEREL